MEAKVQEALLFKPGDIIQDYCEPFMKILYSSQKGSRCDACFEPATTTTLRRCNACKIVSYCGKTCQVRDWKVAHRAECILTYFRSDTTDKSSIFTSSTIDFKYRVLRLFALLKVQPELATQPYRTYDGQSRCFNDLMSHTKVTEKNPEFRKYCMEISTALMKEESLGLNSTDSDPLLRYFLRLSGIFRTNAFCIYNNDKTERLGAGLYIETSVFDHSCRPTAFFLSRGASIQIRAIGPIRKNEKPTISYILSHKTRDDRQTFLNERYNFTCECERCEQDGIEGKVEVDVNRVYQLLESSSAFDETTTWTYVLKVHRELVARLRQMYAEYDERITNQIFWTFTKLIEILEKKCLDGSGGAMVVDPGIKKSLKDLEPLTRDHLHITYGCDHDYSKQFESLLKSNFYK